MSVFYFCDPGHCIGDPGLERRMGPTCGDVVGDCWGGSHLCCVYIRCPDYGAVGPCRA
jgi:hypothetical protein